MAKLLLLTLEFPPDTGGVGRMYGEIFRVLSNNGSLVWTPPIDDAVAKMRADDKKYAIMRSPLLGSWLWPRWLVTIFRLNNHLRNHEYDGIIVGQILPLGTAVWILCFFRRMRYAVFVHGLDISWAIRNRRKKWLVKKITSRAEFVFAANNYVGRLVGKLGAKNEKIIIVHPFPIIKKSVDYSTVINLKIGYNIGNEPILLTIGRLVDRKGHEIVMRALEIVWQKIPDLRYYIIGDGPNRSKLKIIKAALSRPKQVVFLGTEDDERAAVWLKLATIFIMTPRTLPNGDVEGFGIVFLEAAYYGKPAIGTRSGGIPEAVIDGQTGILVNENNIAETANAILTLLQNKDYARNLGLAGQERIFRQFNAQIAADKIIKAFNRRQ